MTPAEILSRLDPALREPCECIEEMDEDLGTHTYLSYSEAFSARMQEQKVCNWICTDTLVGVLAHFFDGEYVCMSYKSCRKGSQRFAWVSHEAAVKVKDFILSLPEDPEINNIDKIGMDEHLPDWWEELKDVGLSLLPYRKRQT